MAFEIKKTKQKKETIYKTLYLTKELADEILKIAHENNTSFNNVVVSMIESCLEDSFTDEEEAFP